MRTIDNYPMQTLVLSELRKADAILWIHTGEWSDLDNFADIPVNFHGRFYPTSEHAFAAAKADLPQDSRDIRLCPTPSQAKSLGRSVPLRPDWEQIKFQVMWDILVAKFHQHPEALDTLMRTGERPIFEGNFWDDDIWGIITVDQHGPVDGIARGRNALGRMLMELREQYRA